MKLTDGHVRNILLLIIVLCLFIPSIALSASFVGTPHMRSRTVYYGEGLDSSNNESYMGADAVLDEPDIDLFFNGIPGHPNVQIPLMPNYSSYGAYVYSDIISGLPTGAAWEDKTYTFWFTDQYGTDQSLSEYIPPTNFFREIGSITGFNASGDLFNPTISWDSIAGFDSSSDYRVRIYGIDGSGIVDRFNQHFETISSDQYYYDAQTGKWYLDYIGDTLFEHAGETFAINIDIIDRKQTVKGWNLECSSTYYAAYSTPVPEPTTMLLFGSGLIGLAGIRRRKTKK